MGKNKSIESKRIKYIKQSRARPRTLKMNNGYIKTGQTNSKDHIPNEARPLFEYRQRLKEDRNETVGIFIDSVINTLFPRFSTVRPTPRPPEALRLVPASTPTVREFLLSNGRYVKLAVLANYDMDCIQFVEYQVIPGIVRRSITYSSYDRAMQVQHLGTIRWKETHRLGVEESQSKIDVTSASQTTPPIDT